MAIAFVQTTGKITKTGTTTSPETVNFPANCTAGNTGVFTCAYFQSSSNRITSVSIGGTAATKVVDKIVGSGVFVEEWRAPNMAGGSSAVTITSTTTSHFISASAEEFSGLDNGAVDLTGNTATGTSTAPSVTYGTLAQADELIYLTYVDNTGSNLATVTVPSGYTSAWTERDGVNQIGGASAWRIVTSSAGASPAFSLSASINWHAVFMTLKAAAGGGGTIVNPLTGIGGAAAHPLAA